MTSDTLLPWLGDVFYLPSWVPFSNVFSIGDVLIAVGICVYIVMNMHPARKKGHSLEDPLT
jgi:lipoprotein signal peptidase